MVAEDRGKVRERKVRLLPPPQLITRDMEMEKDLRFLELKEELLERAHKADACKEQYSRAYGAQTLEELMDVVKDNFIWAVNNGVLDGEFIDKWTVEFNDSKIWHNQSVSSGYLIASGNATVRAYNNATVEASGNATVRAYNNATVEAYNNATVIASGNATVRASGNATVEAYNNATVIASGNATVEAYNNATVIASGNATVRAYNNATVRAYNNATVEASGNAYVTSWGIFECKLSGAAIWRIQKNNTVRYADDNMKFEKITQ